MTRLRGLRGRLISTYLILTLLGVGGLVLRFGLLERTRLIDETEHELELKAFVTASALDAALEKFADGEMTYQDFTTLANHLSEPLDARLTILTLNGDPIFDNRLDFQKIPNQFSQVEVQAALKGGEQHSIRFDPLLGEDRLYTAALISHENEGRGVVQLSISTAPLQSEIRQNWLLLTGTALGITVAVVGVSLWLANYILRPIEQIRRAALHMAAGNLDQHLPISGQDELSDLSRAFNHMAARVKEMMMQQRLFVANASHELRTPLTNIKLRAEALLSGARSDPLVAERFLADIEHEADRMEYLTRDLLTLSRLDTGYTTADPEPLNLKSLLEETVADLRPLAQAKQIRLSLQLPPALPDIMGNEGQLRQVFDNLLSNAFKFTAAGGSVTLSAWSGERELAITVSDTGAGIPPEDLPHIFERFYRADKARTRTNDPGGTGLGLSIVKSIIEAHEGRIDVASTPGEGTTFTLRFPVVSSPRQAPVAGT